MQRKEAKLHQNTRWKLTVSFPALLTLSPLQFNGLLFLLLLILQGAIPVELFCFVSGCREIVLVFCDFFGSDCFACFQLWLIGEG
jgi:hypothetical protein